MPIVNKRKPESPYLYQTIQTLKTVSRDAESHYIIIKGSIHQEVLTIINIYAPNVIAPKNINQLITNIKKLIDSNTIIVGDFNYSQQWTDHLIKKINKETMALNDTLDQMDLTDIFRTFHPKAAEYTFFSSAHGTFSRINHTSTQISSQQVQKD